MIDKAWDNWGELWGLQRFNKETDKHYRKRLANLIKEHDEYVKKKRDEEYYDENYKFLGPDRHKNIDI